MVGGCWVLLGHGVSIGGLSLVGMGRRRIGGDSSMISRGSRSCMVGGSRGLVAMLGHGVPVRWLCVVGMRRGAVQRMAISQVGWLWVRRLSSSIITNSLLGHGVAVGRLGLVSVGRRSVDSLTLASARVEYGERSDSRRMVGSNRGNNRDFDNRISMGGLRGRFDVGVGSSVTLYSCILINFLIKVKLIFKGPVFNNKDVN